MNQETELCCALELVDLGDAGVETKQLSPSPPIYFDSTFGMGSHWNSSRTHHLIDRRRLTLMKKNAVLINTARGSVVDESALARALRERTIAGAGLDVYEHEPKVEATLPTLENVVLLPHLGSATVETRIAMGMRVVENLDRFFAGDVPPDRVTSPI